MKTTIKIRIALLFVAWLVTVCLLIVSNKQFTPYLAFVIVASAIIVSFLYIKKYIRNGKNNHAGNEYLLLDNINCPADLRKLSVNQLPQLCDEIRKFLIETCSQNPGISRRVWVRLR